MENLIIIGLDTQRWNHLMLSSSKEENISNKEARIKKRLWYWNSIRRCSREGIKCQKEDSIWKKPWKNTWGNIIWLFQWIKSKTSKQILVKRKAVFNVPKFIAHNVKNVFWQVFLEYGLLSQIEKIKRKVVVEVENPFK